MPRKQSPTLTDAEVPIMEALWNLGEGRVQHIIDAMDHVRPPAYTTILTMLGVLEKKGYVGHTRAGRAHVFYPLVQRAEVRRNALRYVLSRFFDNSPSLLVQNLAEQTGMRPPDVDRIKSMIEDEEWDDGA